MLNGKKSSHGTSSGMKKEEKSIEGRLGRQIPHTVCQERELGVITEGDETPCKVF